MLKRKKKKNDRRWWNGSDLHSLDFCHGLLAFDCADDDVGKHKPSVPSSWMQNSNFSMVDGWWWTSVNLRNSRSSSAGNQAGGSSASGWHPNILSHTKNRSYLAILTKWINNIICFTWRWQCPESKGQIPKRGQQWAPEPTVANPSDEWFLPRPPTPDIRCLRQWFWQNLQWRWSTWSKETDISSKSSSKYRGGSRSSVRCR